MAAPFLLPFRSRATGLRPEHASRLSSRALSSRGHVLSIRCQREGTVIGFQRAFATEAKSIDEPAEESTAELTEAPREASGEALAEGAAESSAEASEAEQEEAKVRLPRSVQAAYLRPLRRKQTHGLPACDLQLRSYSVRNVEFFADFAMRAAYYLNMPAAGPVPLPKIIQRWTVPRSPFIFKKSQEGWERITLRRLIQIKDAHPETVQIWLAFLRKHQYHGVGMKANVWDHDKLVVGETLEANLKDLKPELDKQWELYGREKSFDKDEAILDYLHTDKTRSAIANTLPPKFSMKSE